MCIKFMYMIVHVYIPIMPTSLFLGVNPLQNVQMEEWSGLRTPSGAESALGYAMLIPGPHNGSRVMRD
jgi:hypothetical protein